ncbi:MAG: superfamily II DNA/RNA helicase [Maribacter sp.]|jgi:superfamily II DNA/RNA helicase
MELTEKSLREILDRLKIAELNEMQKEVLTATDKGDEIVLLSPTGSGKTLGFLLPVLKVLKENVEGVQALVLAPSRELALQIESVFKKMGTPFKVNCCYGGHPIRIEKNNLKVPPALLIGTPGRIGDHLRRESFNPDNIHTLVLDEFDKSLEFGFQKEMEDIISQLGLLHKKILTSATAADEIPAFAGIEAPQRLDFIGDATHERLTIKAIRAENEDQEKIDILFHLLCKIGHEPTLVFCNHRAAVERISEVLWGRGIVHDTFHGGLEQQDRERALIKFRNGSLRLLVTTDLASRGLDIPEIKYVIHYQIPYDEKTFTHRNGRTARVNESGMAYFVMAHKDYFPDYIVEEPEMEAFEEAEGLPPNPDWATVFIGGGKKDKINKIDIVGMFCQKGKLEKSELGLIEVKDYYSYVAVKKDKARPLVKRLRGEKIKKRKVKIEMAK